MSNQSRQINGKSGLSAFCESAVINCEITAVSVPRSGLLFTPRGHRSALLCLKPNRVLLLDDVHNVHPGVKQKPFPLVSLDSD